jgi:hypothetical protein
MTPNTMSAAPTPIRNQDAHAGGDCLRPPSMSEMPMKIAVSPANPNSQPARYARLLSRGCGACKTSTPGMIDSGETAITSARGSSSTIYGPIPLSRENRSGCQKHGDTAQ